MRCALVLLLPLLAGCSHLVVSEPYEPREVPGARLVLREGVALAELRGEPAELGRQSGALFAPQIAELCATMFGGDDDGAQARAGEVLGRALPAPYRREIEACARAAGLPAGRLLVANCVVDFCCSALGAWGEATGGRGLLVARNMDFFPANLLGGHTVVSVVHAPGKRSFAAVGWPGMSGVISGINDRGVAAMILVRLGARSGRVALAEPLAFRVREVLEQAEDLRQAIRILTASPVASGHYVLLCDPHAALTAFQGEDGCFQLLEPEGDVLVASNAEVEGQRLGLDLDGQARVDLGYGLQTDARANCLYRIAREHRGRLDAALLRGALGASYLDHVNAQAMLFAPARRVLQLALGTTFSPAARGAWTELELGPALAGESIERVVARDLGTPEFAPARYEDAPQPTDRERLRRRNREVLAALPRIPDPRERALAALRVADRLEDADGLGLDRALAALLGALREGAHLAGGLDEGERERLARPLRAAARRARRRFAGTAPFTQGAERDLDRLLLELTPAHSSAGRAPSGG
ncbi:MAG: C45 family autoproteolytic acyltransferase/hydrolase [Planctomycetota bacterium]